MGAESLPGLRRIGEHSCRRLQRRRAFADLVETCNTLLGAAASGVLLADEAGELDLVESTGDVSRLVEVMELGAATGPCVESFRTGRIVSVPDIHIVPDPWLAFREMALERGFRAIDAVPMRLGERTIGNLSLLWSDTVDRAGDDLAVARAFADVATIGILHGRTMAQSGVVGRQLEKALDARALIEQAKGVVAHARHISMEEAFAVIRAYARSHRVSPSSVAEAVVQRRLQL